MEKASSVFITSSVMNAMLNAVTKASKKLIRDFGEFGHLTVSKKSAHDFLTNADISSERILIRELSNFRPEYSILSEEYGFEDRGSEYCWVIDPLDGTVNFMHGFQYWCISLALRKADEVIAAVIYDPVMNETFLAEKGNGAFLNNRRLKITSTHYVEDSLIVYFGQDLNVIDILIKRGAFIRKTGSTALNFAYVAAGRFNAFICKAAINEWDCAAGSLIAKEAGAVLRGNNDSFLKSTTVLVTGLDVVDELSEIIGLK